MWRGGYVSRYVPGQVEEDKLRDITEQELCRTYGAPPSEPLLGNYFHLPSRPDRQDPIVLDDSLPTVSFFCLVMFKVTNVLRRGDDSVERFVVQGIIGGYKRTTK